MTAVDERSRSTRAAWWAVVASPLLFAAVVLLWRPWAPTLDMAMTELRVRDVGGRNTPLVGLPGRIGDFPDQGNHPGPWSFYLIAPFYWLSGRRAWGLEFGSAVLNMATIGLIMWLGHRIDRRWGAIVAGAVAAVAVRGYGLSVLTHPWNPYFPVLIWLVVLFATWLVVRGDHAVLVVVVVAATIAAQTHIPYLVNGVPMCALAIGAALWHRHRSDDEHERRSVLRSLGIAVGVGAIFWLPPFVDQIVRDPGNIRMIIEHFLGEPTDRRVAASEAVRVFFRHLDVIALGPDLLTEADAFVYRSGLPGGNGIGGVVIFALWVGAAVWAFRRRHASLMALHVVLATALVMQLLSISRIFGKVWYYLTLWAWGTTLLVALSIVWTACVVIAEHRADLRLRERVPYVAGGVAVVVTVASIVASFGLDVPDPQLSGPLRTVMPDTVEAIDDGVGAAVGPDGTYLVFWQDALFIGSQGYGLVNELERRGYDVGVHDTWRVPVTPHRVLPFGEYDAEVHLTTGIFIDEWRARDGFVEVAYTDDRSDDERERYDELRAYVLERLVEEGRDDLVPVVDENLFGASLDLDLPQDIVDAMSEMIEIGLPIAIFIAPSGNSF
ncbi:hypothetical protein BDK89_2108 [Ilumatobacter fluminis]|uniref:Glycosyltransferase RgtA/B/C/D-like domain-containing protein n=1 Tax=Ilumatobacter fluminis TaxID=467091 RepID=A0A4R7HZ52_9ACTN|nr:hypothetical protein [Ilumatobacter fluminis]TDT16517.1 hypothetical protein BDK89_2108 [Ilumatobacter fluminis]